MTTVLITRPQKQADELAWLLREMGYVATTSPLLSITPTETPAPPHESVGAVMFTSGNALDVPADYSDLTDLPCFCVGATTARLARARHFTNVIYSQGDGAILATLITEKLTTPQKILHIAGRDVTSAAHDVLRDRGYPTVPWTVYQADAATEFTPAALEALQNHKVTAALLYSPRTATTLVKLLSGNGLSDYTANITAIGISEAACAPLSSLTWSKVVASPLPNEEFILQCLKQHCPVGLSET